MSKVNAITTSRLGPIRLEVYTFFVETLFEGRLLLILLHVVAFFAGSTHSIFESIAAFLAGDRGILIVAPGRQTKHRRAEVTGQEGGSESTKTAVRVPRHEVLDNSGALALGALKHGISYLALLATEECGIR